MAFPWTFEENFSDGTLGLFNAETDVGGILDFPHYTELARAGLAPWRDAYCLRARLAGNAVAYLQEDDGFDLLAEAVLYIWFPVCIPADLTLNAGDVVVLFALQSAGPVNEVVVGVTNDGGVYKLFAGETGATRTLAITPSNKKWYQIELRVDIDAGAGNDGTVDFYVDGAQVGAQIASLNQGAITQARYGPSSGTAAGNAGTILLGPILADDARVYPRERFPHKTVWVTSDSHAFVGPCTIESIQLTGTGNDATCTVYDTDRYTSTGTSFSREPLAFARNEENNELVPVMSVPTPANRGVFVALTGTNPQAWVTISGGCPVQSAAQYVDRGRMS